MEWRQGAVCQREPHDTAREERADHGFRDRYLAQVFEERIDRLLDLRMIPVVTHPVAVTVAAEQMHGVFIASVVMLPVAGALDMTRSSTSIS